VPIRGAGRPRLVTVMGHRYLLRGGYAEDTIMGLLDVLNGMQNGPRGPSRPGTQSGGGGMSPLTMAILALLAWKGIKHFSGNQTGSAPQPAPAPGNVNAGLPGGTGGGGLSDMLKGGLGGLLAGGAAGSILSGGLGDLLKQFQQKGLGDQADSWVSNGPNKQIEPGDLASALGADQIEQLSAQSGLSRDDLLQGLSQYLPDVVNHLTPDGRLPDENELAGRI
jgi:uncharacterized protein YidB (DUF937 family)